MREIEKIIVCGYKKDFWLTEICCSSIRYWYPDIPIQIVFDYSQGKVSFNAIKKKFGATVIDLPIKKFGWGLSKIEVLFISSNERVLILDSDTVFTGPVVDYLNSFHEDFVISADYHNEPYEEWMKQFYFDYKRLREFDSDFVFPGYSFNTGQFVATTGILSRNDFNSVIQWQDSPKINRTDLLACADQGVLNYILPKLEKNKKLSIGKANFLLGINYPEIEKLNIKSFQEMSNDFPRVLHWAGSNTKLAKFMKRQDILKFYFSQYNSMGAFSYHFNEVLRSFHYYKNRAKSEFLSKFHS